MVVPICKYRKLDGLIVPPLALTTPLAAGVLLPPPVPLVPPRLGVVALLPVLEYTRFPLLFPPALESESADPLR